MREAREAAQGALRQRCKTASEAVTTAAEHQRAVRCQTQPAEDRQISGHRLRRPPHLGEFDPCGQIPPQRLFSFGPCTARFLFSAQPKRENGGCIAPAIIMAEILPARQGEQKPPRPSGRNALVRQACRRQDRETGPRQRFFPLHHGCASVCSRITVPPLRASSPALMR